MPHKYMAAIISTTAIKSMITPALTMSTIRSELLPKIIALGGVAIGIIKAIEAATVTGTINRSGGIPELSEIPAMIGNTISVVAVLEVNSVRKDIPAVSAAMSSRGLQSLLSVINSPIQRPSPLSLTARANAKPPPNSSTISQGNFTAVFQSINPDFSREGIKNSSTAMAMAIVPSLKYPGLENNCDQPGILNDPISMGDLNVHNKAIITNKAPTHFSSRDMGPSSAYFSFNMVLETFCMFFLGTYRRYKTNNVIKRINKPSGRANNIHIEKLISAASGKDIA